MKLRWLPGTSVMALLLLGSLAGQANAIGPGGWDHLGDGGTPGTPSLNGAVSALNAERPGTLYVGGNFTAAGGVAAANRIAAWNGNAWSAVSSPTSQIANGAVSAIAYDAASGDLFAGGSFTDAGGNADADYLAVWDGTSWAPVCNDLGPPIGATVYALQIIGRTLYVGGSFIDAGGIPAADYLAACDLDNGAASSAVVDPAHPFSGPIYALTVDSNGTLYAGGAFSNLENNPAADNVAYLPSGGGAWQPMGSGAGACSCAVTTVVRGLTAVGTDVYVGTDATDVAGIPQADHVARWNGSAWSAVGSNTAGSDGWFPGSASISGLADDGTNVYATGPSRMRTAIRRRTPSPPSMAAPGTRLAPTAPATAPGVAPALPWPHSTGAWLPAATSPAPAVTPRPSLPPCIRSTSRRRCRQPRRWCRQLLWQRCQLALPPASSRS